MAVQLLMREERLELSIQRWLFGRIQGRQLPDDSLRLNLSNQLNAHLESDPHQVEEGDDRLCDSGRTDRPLKFLKVVSGIQEVWVHVDIHSVDLWMVPDQKVEDAYTGQASVWVHSTLRGG